MHYIKIKRKGIKLKYLALIFIILSILCVFLISKFGNNLLKPIIINHEEILSDKKQLATAVINLNRSMTFVFTPFSRSFNYLNKLLNVTVRSWINAFPNAKIFIFGDNINFDFMNKILPQLTNNYEFITDIEVDEIGLMYIDDIFIKSIDKAKTDLICFIMQDTILAPEVAQKVNFLYNYYSQKKLQFAALGRRCVSSFPLYGNTSYELFMNELQNFDQLRNVNAIQNADFSNDFILFSLNDNRLDFSEIPPFLFGLYEWDTWIPGWMNEKIPLVSLGNECSSYHIQHSKTIVSKDKVVANYDIARIHPKENLIYSDLKLRILNNTLFNNFQSVAAIYDT